MTEYVLYKQKGSRSHKGVLLTQFKGDELKWN